MSNAFPQLSDEDLLKEYRAAKRTKPLLVEDSAHKKYKLALKTACAERGILPPNANGDDQNFSQPEAEVIEMQQPEPLTGGTMPGGPSILGDLPHVSETAAVVNG